MIKVTEYQPAPDAPGPRVPQGTVVYAIGDIHGRCDLLIELQEAIRADLARRRVSRSVIVYLGDYVSRGADSRRVVELVRRSPAQETVTLKGNHEDLLLRFYDGDRSAGRHWFDFNGLDALAHYGVRIRECATLEALRTAFVAVLPPDHLAFFRALRTSHDEGSYHFVHAGVRPGVPIAEQSDDDQIWIRSPFLESEADHGAVVVHGHCISREPVVRPNRIGIDTGAYRTSVLTCLALEGASRTFLQTARGRSDG